MKWILKIEGSLFGIKFKNQNEGVFNVTFKDSIIVKWITALWVKYAIYFC